MASIPQSPNKSKVRLRDEHGHFIKGANIKISASNDSPANVAINPEFEKPLVSVNINNPFKKLLYWLDQIRKHQTTTFAIKLSIPLIALPVIIAGVFSLGRVYGINFQKSQTLSPIPTIPPSNDPNTFLSKAGTLKIAKSPTQTTYLLSLNNGYLLSLQIPQTIDLSKYQNKQVLVTGNYNKNTGVLAVTDIAEIEIFNTTIVQQSSASAAR